MRPSTQTTHAATTAATECRETWKKRAANRRKIEKKDFFLFFFCFDSTYKHCVVALIVFEQIAARHRRALARRQRPDIVPDGIEIFIGIIRIALRRVHRVLWRRQHRSSSTQRAARFQCTL